MALSTPIMAGLVVSALLLVGAILLFFQTKDPMAIMFAVQLILVIWVVVLIVHILRHGIPIRIVDDRKGER